MLLRGIDYQIGLTERLAGALDERRHPEAPQIAVLDMNYSEYPSQGQQELFFSYQHYLKQCYLPLFTFEGLYAKLITAALDQI